jgi:LCP family protein required for cell wall assembly
VILTVMSNSPAVAELPDALAARPTTRPMREPQALSPALRIRRAITLLVIDLLVPGLAQIAAGNRRLGRVLLRCWIAAAVLGIVTAALLVIDRSVVIGLFTSPLVLTVLALTLYALAVIWPLLIADAWRLGRPGLLPTRARIGISVFAVLLMLVTSLPLIEAGRRVWAGADLISGVFGFGKESAAADGRFNVLLLGGDAGPDRVGTRPDSMTLASIDQKTGRTVLFSLPRNLEGVRFAPGSAAATAMPEGWSCGDKCLLNGIYTWGSAHKSLFPGERDPGAAAMKQAIAGVTGLKVNYYALIDLRGFSDLIDAMGGIRVTVNQKVPIGGGTSRVSGYIQPGTQTLMGYRALWYARSRHGASDYARMARQRCVMDAMVHQMDPATVLRNFQGIASASKNVVSTDVPAGELATFIDLAAKAKSQKISSVQFVPPLISPAHPDFALIKSKIKSAITASEKAPTATTPAAAPAGSSAGSSVGSSGGSSGAARSSSPTASPAAESDDIGAECSAA